MHGIPDQWRTFCAKNKVLQHRRQSLAFLGGEALGAVPLVANSKHYDPGKHELQQWTNLDLPDFRNWSVPLIRTAQLAWTDIDVDARPPKGIPWTAALVQEAKSLLNGFLKALEQAQVYARTFGRASLGFRGHAVVQVALSSKDDLESLRRLNMVRPVPVGNLLLRIEVRLQSDKGDPSRKGFTLPGSTYPGLLGEDLELLGWETLGDFPTGMHMPRLPQTPVEAVRKALYSYLLLCVVRPCWVEGGRHHLALEVAGALAHEVNSGFLEDAGQAQGIFDRLLAGLGETGTDLQDRKNAFRDTLQAMASGKNVSGYKILGETIGEEARLALLRMRGGSDPDAISELFRRVVNVSKSLSGNPAYIDLSREDGHELAAAQLVQLYAAHPDFPPFKGKKGENVPLIRYVLGSERIQRVNQLIQIPGVPYGSRFYRAYGTWHPIAEEQPLAGLHTAINVSMGIPLTTAPPPLQAKRWLRLWRRHLEAVTDEDPKQVDALEQAIASKVQRLRDKLALGIAITGGQGIGKSALFEIVLKRLFGSHLIGVTSGMELLERFRFQTLAGSLFYVVEEVNFSKANKNFRELCKNLNKNPSIHVDYKNGRKTEEPNLALPFYLTNDDNPALIIEGQADRSLIVIRGTTQLSMGVDLKGWIAYLQKVADEIVEFRDALEDPELCNAGRHYFMTLPLVKDTDLMATALESTSSEDRRSSLSPAQEAFLEMLESGLIRPTIATTQIHGPFALETITLGIRERLKARGASSFTATNQEVALLIRKLLPGMLGMRRTFVTETQKQHPIHYLTKKMGTLFEHVRQYHGIELTPPYEFEEKDFGDAEEPDLKACQIAWKVSKDATAGFNF